MKYYVELLNFDSLWVTYCTAPTKYYADIAYDDLRNRGFQNHQIRIVER